MKKFIFLSSVVLMAFINSCSTKLDVNADYKDITVVYGLINPSDTNHYIKINKAFLQDNVNANTLAADHNNFDYPDGDLAVTVQEFSAVNNTLLNTYNLTRTVNEIPKDPGVFDNSTNVLYKFVEPNIDRNNTYTLKIVNNKLNKEITSETGIVGNIVVTKPNTISGINFVAGDKFTVNATTGKNVMRIAAFVVFNYKEYYTDSTFIDKKVVMPLGEQKGTNPNGGESLEFNLINGDFFSFVASGVPDPSTIPFFSHRQIGYVTLEFDYAGTELNTYMEVSAPSNGVNQDKPEYTNIVNGIGIFSSRGHYNWVPSIRPAETNLDATTVSQLTTMGLGFCAKSPMQSYNCPFF